MAVVILVSKMASGDTLKEFGGLECDVEGCEALTTSALAEGWFVAPGKHRCPAHFDQDTPERGPQYREVEQAGKRL